jgi:hypothetical protein
MKRSLDVGQFFARPARLETEAQSAARGVERAGWAFVLTLFGLLAVGMRESYEAACREARAKSVASTSKRALHAPEMAPMEAP